MAAFIKNHKNKTTYKIALILHFCTDFVSYVVLSALPFEG